MKASILTMSQSGNTWKVARAIGTALEKNNFIVEHISFQKRRQWNPQDADLLGVGCPVFENLPAEVVPDFIKNCSVDFHKKKVFVFITSGGSPARSLWHLAEALRHKGADVVGGIQVRGCSVFPTLSGLFAGRPNAEDLAEAENFGQELVAHLAEGVPLSKKFELDKNRGGSLYNVLGPMLNSLKKKTPVAVCDASKCDLCGTCIAECPSSSISIKDKKIVIAESCIRCYWCWQICPPMALEMQFSPGQGAIERHLYSEWMERKFGDIKPNEQPGENRYQELLSRKIRVRFDPDNRTTELIEAVAYSRRRGKKVETEMESE